MPCIIRFFLLECLSCGIRCGYAKHRPKKHPSSSLSSQRTAEQAYNICHSSSDYISPPLQMFCLLIWRSVLIMRIANCFRSVS